MARAVLFDLDGTLADTAPDLAGTLNDLRAQLGQPPLPLEFLRPHVSSGVRGMLKAGLSIGAENPDYALLSQRFLDIYQQRLCHGSTLFPGIAELLEALEERDIAWGVVTNKSQRFTLPLLAGLNLLDRSAAVVSGDSSPRSKPYPFSLLLAAAIAGVEPGNCLYVGDDLRDIVAARHAAMPSVAAAYGYLGDGLGIDEWNADHRIDHPMEIIALLGISAQ